MKPLSIFLLPPEPLFLSLLCRLLTLPRSKSVSNFSGGSVPRPLGTRVKLGGGASLAHWQNYQWLWVHLSQSASQPHIEQVHRDDSIQTMLCYTRQSQEKWMGGLWWGVLLGKWFCTGEDPRESKEKKKEGLRKKRQRSTKTKFSPSHLCWELDLSYSGCMHSWRREKQLPAACHQSPESLATDTLRSDPEEALPGCPSLQSSRTLPTHSLRNCLPLTHPPSPASLCSSFLD